MDDLELYDTTLREGVLREGISFSDDDRLKIVVKLDELGVRYIDGGATGRRGREGDFFHRARGLALRQAVLVATGDLGPTPVAPDADPHLGALLATGAPVLALAAPLSERFARTGAGDDPPATLHAAIAHLAGSGRRVWWLAGHAIDGLRESPDFARRCLAAAVAGGAERVILCDTSGGGLPPDIRSAVEQVRREVSVPIGIAARNDADVAVANALAGIAAGATLAAGTVNGYGDRCGVANLLSVLANAQLKLGKRVVADEQLARLAEVSHFVSELANLAPDSHQPYVGLSAFAHRATVPGLVSRRADLGAHHIDPARVGNYRRVLVSTPRTRSGTTFRPAPEGPTAPPAGPTGAGLLQNLPPLEGQALHFAGAEASLELLLRRTDPAYRPPFSLVDYLVIVEKRRRGTGNGHGTTDDLLSEATVKVRVAGELLHTVAEGNGPVNALDGAVRKALVQFYPALAATRLLDYKVRVIDETAGTAAHVRVLIESTDGERRWSTVGSHGNVIEASWLALADSLEYALLLQDDAR